MGFRKDPCYCLLLYICIGFWSASQCSANEVKADQTAQMIVNASDAAGRSMPETLFGIFFEVCSLSLSHGSFLLGSSDFLPYILWIFPLMFSDNSLEWTLMVKFLWILFIFLVIDLIWCHHGNRCFYFYLTVLGLVGYFCTVLSEAF